MDIATLVTSAAGIATIIVVLAGFISRLEKRMDARFEKVDARFEKIDARFETSEQSINARFDKVDARFETSERSVDARFEASEKSMAARFDKVDREIMDLRKDVIELKVAVARIEGTPPTLLRSRV